jgi:hypothetical protein
VSPDGYTLLGKEATLVPDAGRSPLGPNSGYEYDYQEPYFQPANEEEALVMQLNTKLAVTEVSREVLE